MLRNLKNEWWHAFVNSRDDVVGLDSSIILHPKVWEASGHLDSFNDALIDCRNCRGRIRADQYLEEHHNIKSADLKLEICRKSSKKNRKISFVLIVKSLARLPRPAILI